MWDILLWLMRARLTTQTQVTSCPNVTSCPVCTLNTGEIYNWACPCMTYSVCPLLCTGHWPVVNLARTTGQINWRPTFFVHNLYCKNMLAIYYQNMGLYHFELCKRNSPTGQYEWPTDLTSHLYAHSGPLPTGVVYWSAAQLVSQQMVGSPTGQSANGRISNWSVDKWPVDNWSVSRWHSCVISKHTI